MYCYYWNFFSRFLKLVITSIMALIFSQYNLKYVITLIKHWILFRKNLKLVITPITFSFGWRKFLKYVITQITACNFLLLHLKYVITSITHNIFLKISETRDHANYGFNFFLTIIWNTWLRQSQFIFYEIVQSRNHVITQSQKTHNHPFD